MRTEDQIRERIRFALIEEIGDKDFKNLATEPENIIPAFIERVTNRVLEVTLDEIAFNRRY